MHDLPHVDAAGRGMIDAFRTILVRLVDPIGEAFLFLGLALGCDDVYDAPA
jgi:hypothetical protein